MHVSPFSSMGFRNHIKIQTCLQLGTEPVTRTRLCIHGLSLEGGIRVGINARRQWLSSDLIYKGTCTKERNWGAEDTNAVVGRDFSPRKTAHPCLRAAGNGCMPLRKLLQTPHGTLYVGYPLERWRFPGKKATHLSFFFSKTYLSGWRDLSSFLFSVSVLLLSFFFFPFLNELLICHDLSSQTVYQSWFSPCLVNSKSSFFTPFFKKILHSIFCSEWMFLVLWQFHALLEASFCCWLVSLCLPYFPLSGTFLLGQLLPCGGTHNRNVFWTPSRSRGRGITTCHMQPFFLFLLLGEIHNRKLTIIKWTIQWRFSIITALGNYHLYVAPENFYPSTDPGF